ncbi:MAG: PD40 domain-containing protein [Geobacter sp.]|nr:PD40 domain-containing protein [Geobacter sp.]
MRLLSTAICLLSAFCLLSPMTAAAVGIEGVSTDTDSLFGSGASTTAATSGDGRFVAFESAADNLVPGDTNGYNDIFVRDRLTGKTDRVSIGSDGNQANGASRLPAISSDGRFVAFASLASNLVPNDTNNAEDVFVHDRTTGITERVSLSNSGAEGAGVSYSPAVSGDGRFVAFVSSAANLVLGDTNGLEDVFVRDRSTGTTERVSVTSSGGQSNGKSLNPAISPDGRFVVFSSAGSLAGGALPVTNIYLRDRASGTTELVSHMTGFGFSYSNIAAISVDGRYVAFDSSGMVIAHSMRKPYNVFVHDRATGSDEAISIDWNGVLQGGSAPAISADGRYVAFQSTGALLPEDVNGLSDVYQFDRQTRRMERISTNCAGALGNGNSQRPAIAADGWLVAFDSLASNLVSGDSNGVSDIFVSDRRALVADAGPDQAVEQTSPAGTYLTLDGSGSKGVCGGELFYSWGWDGGAVDGQRPTALFSRGSHEVTLTVSNGTATATDTVNVSVRDTTPPTATISADPGLLWPPNHKMVNVRINGLTEDAGSGVATVHLAITDEYGMLTGSADSFGATVPLEAWRDGTDRDGRHYTITAVVTDNAGNSTTVTTEALVPHDMRGK